MKLADNKRLIYGMFIILIASCFTGWFYYTNEPCHEDLGAYFYDLDSGIRFTNFSQVLELTKNVYMLWSGRIPGYFLNFVTKLVPRGIQAILIAVIFSSNIILSIRIIFKNTVKALSSPIIFVVMYLALYWFRPATGVNYRWEFVTIYSFSVTVILLYYNLAGSRFESDDNACVEQKHKGIVLTCIIQLIGIVAGMCHEVISFGLIALIGTEWIVDMIRHKAKFTDLFGHWGLCLGYLIGFFSPGNMARLNGGTTIEAYSASVTPTEQVSEAVEAVVPSAVNTVIETTEQSGIVRIMEGFLNRLRSSFAIHQVTIVGTSDDRQEFILFLVILALALISIAALLWIGQAKRVCNMIIGDIGFMVSCVSSVILWAVSYRQPEYGVWLPMIFIYISLLEFVVLLPDIFIDHSTISTSFFRLYGIMRAAFPVIAIVAFAFIYRLELSSFAHTSEIRRERISYAQENGLSEITIPKYDENLSPLRYTLNSLNSQKEYDTGYYTLFYGVHLIIDD